MPSRALYTSRRLAGLCGSCGKREPRAGRRTCPDCAAQIRGANASREADRRARGVCVQCGREPAADGQVRCLNCAAKQADRMRRPTQAERK